jgi:MFS family permease
MLLAAVATFAVGSLVSATAVDMAMLIAGRAVTGIAGGGIIQLVTVVISDLFSVRYGWGVFFSFLPFPLLLTHLTSISNARDNMCLTRS